MQIPIATNESVGLMSNADVLAVQSLLADENSLKGAKKNHAVELNTETPSQQYLNDVYYSGLLYDPGPLSDGTTLWDETYSKEYTYFESDGLWHDRGSSTISLGSNSSPGIVQGSTAGGKVYIENDGTMSLNGYDTIKGDISGLAENKLDKVSIVDNVTSTNTDKPLSAKQGKALNDSIASVSGVINTHVGNTSNPHNVSKAQVGLGNVDNTSDANKPVSTAQATAINAKQDKLSGSGLVKSTSGVISYDTNSYALSSALTKAGVGLGNVDNTSDANKPVSTAQATAINAKQAQLNGTGFIKASGTAISYDNTAYATAASVTNLANKIQLVTALPSSPTSGVLYVIA
jgi:hypothetical protein